MNAEHATNQQIEDQDQQFEDQEREREEQQQDGNQERAEQQNRNQERRPLHNMNLRQNRNPRFRSYVHPEFDNIEFENVGYQLFQKDKKLHKAYKPARTPTLTFEEIKAGADYTVEQLTHASHKHVLTQMFANKAYKKLGEPAHMAMFAEYAQLQDKRVYKDDIDQDAITDEEDRMALSPIDLVKVKRDGRVKGRSCVDGRPQREHIPKEQCASPTIANTSLMLMMSIAAKEKRKVATADVAGAYLHADMDDFVLVKFTGSALKLMCKVNPAYEKLVRVRDGKRVMYLRLAKALYGCLKSALLWYNLFKGTLEKMGFVLNKYGHCVANKMIKGKQCTIGWWVDDNAMTHRRNKVLDGVVAAIEKKFGKMTVTRGNRHTFLLRH